MLSFSSIIGHHFQRDTLSEDLRTGNVAHAYLFAGPRHLGKFTIAKWFAVSLLSPDAGSPEEREGVALQAEKLLHPDLLVLDQLWIQDVCEDIETIARSSNIPQHHRSKSKAKTDTISIDDVRALQDRLIGTGMGRYRCCLIRSAERMQDEAVTSLLKILEEPPQGVVFLLTTQALPSLPATLLSRCRILRFPPLPTRELMVLLKEETEESRQFLLHLAQGAPGIIRRLQRDPDLLREEQSLHASASAFWHLRPAAEKLRLLSPLQERGEESCRLLFHLALALWERGPHARASSVRALSDLAAGLETNASRHLLVRRFVMQVHERE